MTKHDAREIAKLMKAPDIFPEARAQLSRTLLDYYKELLSSTKVPKIPTPRRWQ